MVILGLICITWSADLKRQEKSHGPSNANNTMTLLWVPMLHNFTGWNFITITFDVARVEWNIIELSTFCFAQQG